MNTGLYLKKPKGVAITSKSVRLFPMTTERRGESAEKSILQPDQPVPPQIYNVWGKLVVSFMTNDFHDNGDGELILPPVA